jgi:hypothetical protein
VCGALNEIICAQLPTVTTVLAAYVPITRPSSMRLTCTSSRPYSQKLKAVLAAAADDHTRSSQPSTHTHASGVPSGMQPRQPFAERGAPLTGCNHTITRHALKGGTLKHTHSDTQRNTQWWTRRSEP